MSETSKPRRRGRTRKTNKQPKVFRDYTLEESYQVIDKHLGKHREILDFKNHRKYNKLKNTYRFTVNIISLNFLTNLMNDKEVVSVHFSPSIPPPGTGFDGTSLRYKVYVEYYEKEE
tara:strand:- start:11240 stop:11590 length:351 start_codon:yes stop_codon:yes gene_type:complete